MIGDIPWSCAGQGSVTDRSSSSSTEEGAEDEGESEREGEEKKEGEEGPPPLVNTSTSSIDMDPMGGDTVVDVRHGIRARGSTGVSCDGQ